MKKGKVFFHPIEGSGQLSISWSLDPKGDAIEAKNGEGVGFFSDKGELLGVIFDEVQSLQDHQTLEFARYKIEAIVKNGKVTYKIHHQIDRRPAKKRISSASRNRKRSKTKIH